MMMSGERCRHHLALVDSSIARPHARRSLIIAGVFPPQLSVSPSFEDGLSPRGIPPSRRCRFAEPREDTPRGASPLH